MYNLRYDVHHNVVFINYIICSLQYNAKLIQCGLANRIGMISRTIEWCEKNCKILPDGDAFCINTKLFQEIGIINRAVTNII